MPQWLRRIRGTLGLGLLWAVAWAVVGGGLMEGVFDRRGEIVDMWPQLLGIVGFLGGVLFGIVVSVVGRWRRLEESSLAGFAGLGAAAGVLQGLLAMVAVGAPLLFTAFTVVGSAILAAGSLGMVRWATARQLPGEAARDALPDDRR